MACKGYGVDFAECSSYTISVASDVYYGNKAMVERIKKINEPVGNSDKLKEKKK